jgi:hypothetical protein
VQHCIAPHFCSPLTHIQTKCSPKFVILYQFDRSTVVSYALKVWQYHHWHTLCSRRACRVSFSIESWELSSAQRLSCWHSRTAAQAHILSWPPITTVSCKIAQLRNYQVYCMSCCAKDDSGVQVHFCIPTVI